MKIAFLIQAHSSPNMLRALVEALEAPWASFFIHIDKKVDIAPFRLALAAGGNVTFLEDRTRVYWGGWSQVDATLKLISAAYNSTEKFDRFVLLSGGCFPIRSKAAFRNFLENTDNEFISFRPMPDKTANKSISRLNAWHLEGGYRERGFGAACLRMANVILRMLPVRNVKSGLAGMVPYAGSQWWVLSTAAIEHIFKTIEKSPSLLHYFRTTKIPDECFFQTILANSVLQSKMRRNLTYTDWSNPLERPCHIEERHLEFLLKQDNCLNDVYGSGPMFFARKFSDKNVRVAKSIEEAIAKSKT